MRKSCTTSLLAVLLSVYLPGCGGNSKAPPTIPVRGRVTLEGQPVKAGRVYFQPVDPQKGAPAEGEIDAAGRFELSSRRPGDGVRPGEYLISIVAYEGQSTETKKSMAPVSEQGLRPAIPERYFDPQTSQLRQVIDAAGGSQSLAVALVTTPADSQASKQLVATRVTAIPPGLLYGAGVAGLAVAGGAVVLVLRRKKVPAEVPAEAVEPSIPEELPEVPAYEVPVYEIPGDAVPAGAEMASTAESDMAEAPVGAEAMELEMAGVAGDTSDAAGLAMSSETDHSATRRGRLSSASRRAGRKQKKSKKKGAQNRKWVDDQDENFIFDNFLSDGAEEETPEEDASLASEPADADAQETAMTDDQIDSPQHADGEPADRGREDVVGSGEPVGDSTSDTALHTPAPDGSESPEDTTIAGAPRSEDAGAEGQPADAEAPADEEEDDDDPERKAAKWVLRSQGTIRVIMEAGIDDIEDLPEIPFHLQVISFEGSTDVTDERLQTLQGLKKLHSLDVSSTSITDAGLSSLQGLTALTRLSLSSTAVTTAGVAQLVPLKQLKVLLLFKTKVDDGVMLHARQLPQLETLELKGTEVSDMRELAGLQHLSLLDLSGTKITDEGLAGVKDLPGLKRLALSNTAVSDAGLVHIGAATSLKILLLYKSKVTDAGLAELSALQNLELLELKGTAVTDAGLEHLAKLSGLKQLYVGDTAVTLEAARKLRETLPGCKIHL